MTELEALDWKIKEALRRTEAFLKKRYDNNRSLHLLNMGSRKKLYNLFIWEERYSLPIEDILEILCDYYDYYNGVFEVSRRKPGKPKKRLKASGLPTSVPILMGQNSELQLQDSIKALYPEAENVQLKKQLMQERLIHRQLVREGIITETDSLHDCQTVQAYLDNYDKKMARLFSRMATIRNFLRNNTRNYRNNPWR